MLRRILQDSLLVPAVRAFCKPLCASADALLDQRGGPFVIVANHASHLDTPALLAALPPGVRRRTRVAAAEDYFYRRRWFGALCTLGIGSFPFPRQGRVGTQRAAQLLAQGWNIVLFPQGTRGSGERMPFRPGVGHLLLETGATAVPVAISGTRAAWPRQQTWPRRGPVQVRIGVPWRPDAGTSPRQVAEELERRVNELGR